MVNLRIPIIHSIDAATQASNGLVTRQIDPSSFPPGCGDSCQVLNTMINCNMTASCICDDSIGSCLQSCMDCFVFTNPTMTSAAQHAIDYWNQVCNGSLFLDGVATPTITGSSIPLTTTGGSTPPATTATSSVASSSGGSSPATGSNSGAVSLKTMSISVLVVAAAFGAFTTF